MEGEEVVIKHRGRRFKRSSLKSNGAALVKPIHPPNGASSQFQPHEQKGKNRKRANSSENSVCMCAIMRGNTLLSPWSV